MKSTLRPYVPVGQERNILTIIRNADVPISAFRIAAAISTETKPIKSAVIRMHITNINQKAGDEPIIAIRPLPRDEQHMGRKRKGYFDALKDWR